MKTNLHDWKSLSVFVVLIMSMIVEVWIFLSRMPQNVTPDIGTLWVFTPTLILVILYALIEVIPMLQNAFHNYPLSVWIAIFGLFFAAFIFYKAAIETDDHKQGWLINLACSILGFATGISLDKMIKGFSSPDTKETHQQTIEQ